MSEKSLGDPTHLLHTVNVVLWQWVEFLEGEGEPPGNIKSDVVADWYRTYKFEELV